MQSLMNRETKQTASILLYICYRFFVIFFLAAAALTRVPAYAQVGDTLSLDEALKSLDSLPGGSWEFSWDPLFCSGVFSKPEHRIVFQTGIPGEPGLAVIDGRELISSPAPFMEDGRLCFPKAFVGAVKAVLERAVQDETRFRIAAIIVDPGHGGKDTGAIGEHVIKGEMIKVLEKDITLKVAQDLHTRLSRAFPDKQVLLTRTGDTYPSLENRVDIANNVELEENEAVVFISIHANASFNKTVRGYEIWYLRPDVRRELIDRSKYTNSKEVIDIYNAMLEEEFTTESIMMAQSILKSFDEVLGKDLPSRGIKAEEWFVVRNARMPSVLVEMGFITNEKDAALMLDEGYLKKFSEALYKGIMTFVVDFEASGGFIVAE
jgi:N-acetylmuramoyl-L-alanine amidase